MVRPSSDPCPGRFGGWSIWLLLQIGGLARPIAWFYGWRIGGRIVVLVGFLGRSAYDSDEDGGVGNGGE